MTLWRDELLENKHLKAFVDHLILKSERTQLVYLYELKYICDHFGIEYGNFDPEFLTQEHYDSLIRDKIDTLKKSTLNLRSRVFSLLSNIYGLGIKTKLLKESDKVTDYITFKELQEIINKADKEVAAISAFMFCTGLRPVSIVSIKKDQLVLNSERPYIRNVKMKGGKRTDIVILYPDITLPLLRWYMQYKNNVTKGYSNNEKVFVSQKNATSERYVYEQVRKGSEILGRKVSPRMLRKGLGVHLKEKGYRDETRRRILGHSDVRTTVQAYSDYGTEDIFREHDQKRNNTEPIHVQQNNSQIEKEYCPFCRAVVEHEMMLCPSCWREIKRICQNCKRYISSEWERCAYCGFKIKKEEKKYIKGKLPD
ncbi:MAG: tyrosine-type recombinase/integrase [Theionarchaea archaeon]|nr:tyrosine-type recombinase/integrase [Theionarchaea archaeon]